MIPPNPSFKPHYYSEPSLKILHSLKVSALLSITMLKVTHVLLRAGVR